MVKIIIIGAGISGLSSYLFLRKHLLDADSSSPSQHEIKIYEAYDIHRSKLLRSGNRTGTDPGTTSKPIKDDDNDDDDIAATEAAFTPQSIGGALGVMHNGLNVLSRLDSGDGTGGSSPSSVVAQMARRGHPVERWQMNAARGFKLGEICLAPKPQPRHSDTTADSASTAEPCVYPMIMIGRQACWEILRDHVLHTAPDANVVVRKVVDVVIGDEATLSRVQFQDGSEEEADLVIGADGLRSVLRRAMFRDFKPQPGLRDGDGDGRSTGWIKTLRGWLPSMGRDVDMDNRQTDYITPHYEGLVGVGGFVPSSVLQSAGHQPGTMTIVFGGNGFFGSGYLTSSASASTSATTGAGIGAGTGTKTEAGTGTGTATGQSMAISPPGPLSGWWSTFSSEDPYPFNPTSASASTSTPPRKRDINSSGPKPSSFDRALALDALLRRHASWKNANISAILKYIQSEDDTHENQDEDQDETTNPSKTSKPLSQHTPNHQALEGSYPTWTTPELPHWQVNGRAVLIGDAAHALQPSSGQGTSQALEDSEALARCLGHYLCLTPAAPPPPPKQSLESTPSSLTMTRPKALETALKTFETLRRPRVHAIRVRSERTGKMKSDAGLLVEWVMYLAIWIMSWFHDDYNDAILHYDLPAQVREAIRRQEAEADTATATDTAMLNTAN